MHLCAHGYGIDTAIHPPVSVYVYVFVLLLLTLSEYGHLLICVRLAFESHHVAFLENSFKLNIVGVVA